MGSVFGKQSVAEPAFEVILERAGHQVQTPYEIRKYGERFAAEVYFNGTDTGDSFRTLASYIGVFGEPENEGEKKISMTAPVVMESSSSGTPIEMTAPVVTQNSEKDDQKVMKFILPAEYNDKEKIPKPLNPAVHIEEIPAQVGAVHRFSGSWNEASKREKASELASQLRADGLDHMTFDYVADHYQFWGYNPPFTLPMFRRNEIWLELSDEQLKHLTEKFDAN